MIGFNNSEKNCESFENIEKDYKQKIIKIINESVLIVAHPDDEVLWASSVLNSVSKVIICFTHQYKKDSITTLGRKLLRNNFPLSNVVFLNLTEANVFDKGKWAAPKETEYGMHVEQDNHNYKKNYLLLKEKLRDFLIGVKVVITHNPWGEYGSEEHVQVHRAVCSLSDEFGFDTIVTGYVSEKSQRFMMMQRFKLDKIYCVLDTNHDLQKNLQKLYIENNAWTWPDNYKWPAQEIFYSMKKLDSLEGVVKDRVNPSDVSMPLNFIWINPLPASDNAILIRSIKILILAITPKRVIDFYTNTVVVIFRMVKFKENVNKKTE